MGVFHRVGILGYPTTKPECFSPHTWVRYIPGYLSESFYNCNKGVSNRVSQVYSTVPAYQTWLLRPFYSGMYPGTLWSITIIEYVLGYPPEHRYTWVYTRVYTLHSRHLTQHTLELHPPSWGQTSSYSRVGQFSQCLKESNNGKIVPNVAKYDTHIATYIAKYGKILPKRFKLTGYPHPYYKGRVVLPLNVFRRRSKRAPISVSAVVKPHTCRPEA